MAKPSRRRTEAAHHDDRLCPYFKAAMDVLGRRWNGLIIASLAEGSLRFSELRERLPAVGDRMLAARLRELEARGLVVRSVAPGPPVRVGYALTTAGREFGTVARAISQWGQRFAKPQRAKTPRAKVMAQRGDAAP